MSEFVVEKVEQELQCFPLPVYLISDPTLAQINYHTSILTHPSTRTIELHLSVLIHAITLENVSCKTRTVNVVLVPLVVGRTVERSIVGRVDV